jgi:hypothetical protein
MLTVAVLVCVRCYLDGVSRRAVTRIIPEEIAAYPERWGRNRRRPGERWAVGLSKDATFYLLPDSTGAPDRCSTIRPRRRR